MHRRDDVPTTSEDVNHQEQADGQAEQTNEANVLKRLVGIIRLARLQNLAESQKAHEPEGAGEALHPRYSHGLVQRASTECLRGHACAEVKQEVAPQVVEDDFPQDDYLVATAIVIAEEEVQYQVAPEEDISRDVDSAPEGIVGHAVDVSTGFRRNLVLPEGEPHGEDGRHIKEHDEHDDVPHLARLRVLVDHEGVQPRTP
mmetsp:Transcript_39712/g.84754  ORF Transcript_39712/g.84754 Transcript_39712/m.84754 type:complete len:201 (-) Transcript_39712:573-1175(-)